MNDNVLVGNKPLITVRVYTHRLQPPAWLPWLESFISFWARQTITPTCFWLCVLIGTKMFNGSLCRRNYLWWQTAGGSVWGDIKSKLIISSTSFKMWLFLCFTQISFLPHVVADALRDTLIHLSSASPLCSYTDTTLICLVSCGQREQGDSYSRSDAWLEMDTTTIFILSLNVSHANSQRHRISTNIKFAKMCPNGPSQTNWLLTARYVVTLPLKCL